MIKLENTEVVGWEHAIRGMRNPKNSWDRMDSEPCATSNYSPNHCADCPHIKFCHADDGDLERNIIVGPNDHKLMMSLAKGGPVHAKYRRMIVVYVTITAPLYWWKEMDTYRVGTVTNSCSTMHKIHDKEFTREDFSFEHVSYYGSGIIDPLIDYLNLCREGFVKTNDKKYWWDIIQLLPSSYNQKRTLMLNYETLANIYEWRRNHKLDEWHGVCKWIESLPYSEIITGPILEKEN